MSLTYQDLVLAHQSDFLRNVFSFDRVRDKQQDKGIEIYRRNLQATAAKALQITFPTVTQQIGERMMSAIAGMMLTKQPPHKGDWAEWGGGLPNFLTSLPELEEYPFVSESALLDLALHHGERAINQHFDEQSIYLLTEYDLDEIYIDLNRAVQFFTCKYPVIELRNLNSDDQLANERLQAKFSAEDFKQNVLVFRPHLKAEVKEINRVELEWLTLMAKQVSIGHAVKLMSDTTFDFSKWLPQAIQQNLIVDLFTY